MGLDIETASRDSITDIDGSLSKQTCS